MNRLRVGCIRRLRESFGKRFIGGLEPTDYARQNFPDCVLEGHLTRKANYLRVVRGADVCISTVGLLQSNPWKLGEYVALAKAIVSQPLAHEVPGDFLSGRNYLEFHTENECVAAVQALLDDPRKRYTMMANNYAYYQAFLRPDMLVWNTLQTALVEANTVARA